jgi:hypothetical protein
MTRGTDSCEQPRQNLELLGSGYLEAGCLSWYVVPTTYYDRVVRLLASTISLRFPCVLQNVLPASLPHLNDGVTSPPCCHFAWLPSPCPALSLCWTLSCPLQGCCPRRWRCLGPQQQQAEWAQFVERSMLQALARGRLGFAPEAYGAGEASVQTCVLPDADGPSGSESVGNGEKKADFTVV